MLGAALPVFGSGVALAAPPALMLANIYRPRMPLADYWVSEKMDGVRGYWDGRRLWTRGGEPVAAPAWFTAGWPATPMDGELWAGRGQFTLAVSTVRQQAAPDDAWRRIRFMVFDLPAQSGNFTSRLALLNGLLSTVDTPYIRPVAQNRVANHEALMAQMHTVVRGGGEGLMLHRGDAPYRAERNDDLLKVKPHEDADARVVAHVAGQGKYAGQLGALLVELPDGRRMRIGSGFTDADRRDPPPVGSWISYRFRGTHDGGIPRFTTFLRRRPDLAG
ncbi:DNA ligase [uncultured Xylophilus sp.]|uniref:DNA ligase n=1 Tax=uncultured Xylophilus sp. TaxID=296832 RepID=UPI0025F158F8|nr:DNA ligase [uncultured Xylophilus sp.]